jgi:peptidoglycan/LPS O-acetylase OafA/YrhL
LYVLNFWPEFLTGGVVFLALWFKPRKTILSRLPLLVPAAFAFTGCFALPDSERGGQMIGASVFALVLYCLHPLDDAMCRLRPLVWLAWVGTFSYSLYLVHAPLGRVINLGARIIPHDSAGFILLVVGSWATAIAGAWVFYQLCECPLERWRHRMRGNQPTRSLPGSVGEKMAPTTHHET